MRDRFDSILCVCDDAVGSDDALVNAVSLAQATGARLTVAKLLGVGPTYAIDEAQKQLTRIMPWIERQGVHRVTMEVLVGTPYVEICRHVLQHGHDLVIAGSETGRGVKDIVLGSTAINLMRKCPCTVWIVKPGKKTPRPAVLAAIDVSPDDASDPLSAKVLDLAAALARAKGACLHVVHCWDVAGSDAEMLRSEIRDETRHEILNRQRSLRIHALDRLVARYRPSLEIEVHLPRGSPHPCIVSLADQHAIGLVVMGTSCRGGLPGLLIGNAVERVLGSVRCDVLAVKPDEFRTPIPAPLKQSARSNVHSL